MVIDASVSVVVLAVFSIFNLAIIQAAVTLIFWINSFYLLKKNEAQNIIEFTFFLTLSTRALVAFKSISNIIEVSTVETIEVKE